MLRKYLFSLTHELLKKHYNENYSDRCLQSSMIIRSMLSDFGIASFLVEGALCSPIVSKRADDIGWQGFWDKDHHYWLITEFGELIDLTIHQINRHQQSRNIERHDPPPIWWDDCGYLIKVIKYLPQMVVKPNDSCTLPDYIEQEKINNILNNLKIENNTFYQKYTAPTFTKILCNTSDLERWGNEQDPWTNGLAFYYDHNVDLPPWIQNREHELLKPKGI